MNGITWNAYLLPYLPYFSACRGFDSHIPLFLLLENEINCNLVNYNETAYVDQWNFINAPSALQVESAMDSCSWSIQCMYEEEISKVNKFQDFEHAVHAFSSLIVCQVSSIRRWFELDVGQTLFYITRDPFANREYALAQMDPDGMRLFTNMVSTSEAIFFKIQFIINMFPLYYCGR